MKQRRLTLKMIISALMLALAYVLPFLTGQIPEVGSMLCPMHIPVLLCGFICGWPWGLAVGIAAPLFRSLTLGMPPIFPTAVCMAFELAVYGAISGLMHRLLPKKARIHLSLASRGYACGQDRMGLCYVHLSRPDRRRIYLLGVYCGGDNQRRARYHFTDSTHTDHRNADREQEARKSRT